MFGNFNCDCNVAERVIQEREASGLFRYHGRLMPAAEAKQLDGTHRTSTARWFAGPAVLFVIVTGMFWRLALTNQYTWMNNPDMAWQVAPWYQFQATEWHRGQFPLGDPHE